MERKSGWGLVTVCLAAVLVLAACGQSGHTYVMTPTSSLAAGIYLTIVSPVALPQGLLDEAKKSETFVERAQGPEICTYSKVIHGIRGKYASLNGETLTLKVNGTSPLISALCSGLQHRAFNPTVLAGHSSTHDAKPVTAIRPTGFDAKNLALESRFINTTFFWAGDQRGYRYEFRRTTNRYLYVRYLPPGVPIGGGGARFLTIATYPFPGAYEALKKQAKSRAVAGPRGSIVYQRPQDPRSVLMAFPGVNDEIEIYAPSPAVAVSTAESGKIEPVR